MTRFLAVLGVVVLAIQLVWLPRQVRSSTPDDADVYHQAAERLVAGQPVYGGWTRVRLDQPPGAFLYPPSALVILKPFAGASREAFRWGWYALIIGAFWALAAALGRIVLERTTLAGVLAAGAVLQIVPGVAPLMTLGNADLVVWALVAWAFAVPRAAGGLLMAAAALKLYPIVLIAAWANRAPFIRQATVVGWIAFASVVFFVGGPVTHEWLTVGMPALREGVFAFGNFSLSAQLVHIFVRDMTQPLPRAAAAFLAVFPYAVIGVVAWTQRHRSRAKYGALVLIATVWAAPICWWWRLVLALVLAGTVWIRERKEQSCVLESSSESSLECSAVAVAKSQRLSPRRVSVPRSRAT